MYLNVEIWLHSVQSCVSEINEREPKHGGGAKQQSISIHIILFNLDQIVMASISIRCWDLEQRSSLFVCQKPCYNQHVKQREVDEYLCPLICTNVWLFQFKPNWISTAWAPHGSAGAPVVQTWCHCSHCQPRLLQEVPIFSAKFSFPRWTYNSPVEKDCFLLFLFCFVFTEHIFVP